MPELNHIIYVAMYPGEFSLSEHGYAFKYLRKCVQ